MKHFFRIYIDIPNSTNLNYPFKMVKIVIMVRYLYKVTI